MAKMLIFTGLLIAGVGVLFLLFDKIPYFGKLPGDMYIQRKALSFYFPITTSIIISILLTVIFYFVMRK